MRKEELISTFKNPSQLANFDAEQLASLVQENPCSGMLRMLYVKTLKETDDIRFEQELRTAAAHLPMRSKLYEWLKQPVDFVQTTVTTTPKSTTVESQNKSISGSSDAPETPLPKEENKKAPADEALIDLERQYLTEAVGVSIGMEVEAEMEQLAEEEGRVESMASIESKAVDEAPAETKREPKEIHSFLDFISLPTGAERAIEVEIEPSKGGAEDLIASFIRSEKREKVEFFDPERMAKASLVDNEELVTETLARVYQHQGNLQKALRAYKSLQLKYPEKRLYFAGRIERINELIKNR